MKAQVLGDAGMGWSGGDTLESVDGVGSVLQTAPRDCMTELKTGCSCSISCTRGSIPRIPCMHPIGLFRRIFGEYSVSPRPPYNPFSYPVCGVRLLTVKPLFHLFLMERQADEQEPLSM